MADNASLPPIDANMLAQMLGVAPKEVYSVEDSVRRYCEWLRRQVTLDS